MKKAFPIVTTVTTALLFLIFLARLNLVITRYIDPDEFAHLHWSFLLASGNIPYRDFFMNFTPLYFWILSFVFLFPYGTGTIIMARLFEYTLYVATTFAVYILALRVTRSTVRALIATALFSVFPMTFDKSLELRPDTLMALLFLGSFILLLSPRALTKVRVFLAAFLMSASVTVLLKVAFAIPAFLYLAIQAVRTRRKFVPWLLAGLILPPLTFLLYGLLYRILPGAIENIIRGSAYIKAGEGAFSPWKSLSPYPLVYVENGGVSFPWIVNTAIFLFTIIGLTLLWFQDRVVTIVFVLTLLGSAVSLYLFPTPYLQYFIPISAIVAIPAAVAVTWLIQQLRHPVLIKGTLLGLIALLGISFLIQYRIRSDPKNSSDEQFGVIDSVLAVSRPDESFYDMVGSYIFRPDGSYVCCNIYSQFADRLRPKPPTLAQSLVERQTKFVILDRAGKVFWLPTSSDLTFLMAHYVPSPYKKIYTVGSRFRCMQGTCVQLNVHGQPISQNPVRSFEIVVGEEYKITTEPAGLPVSINDTITAEMRQLSPGSYRFSVPNDVTELTIALNR